MKDQEKVQLMYHHTDNKKGQMVRIVLIKDNRDSHHLEIIILHLIKDLDIVHKVLVECQKAAVIKDH
jgi:hypothetical protein